MSDLRHRTLVSVRASCNPKSNTKVFARSASAEFGVPFSLDRAQSNLIVPERLLGLISTDVAGLFSKVATQKRSVVDRIESIAKAELDAEMMDMEGLVKREPERTTGFAGLAESLETLEV